MIWRPSTTAQVSDVIAGVAGTDERQAWDRIAAPRRAHRRGWRTVWSIPKGYCRDRTIDKPGQRGAVFSEVVTPFSRRTEMPVCAVIRLLQFRGHDRLSESRRD